jgi:hypothetical protein
VAVSRHADTPSQGGSVTAGSSTPYTTPVDVNQARQNNLFGAAFESAEDDS